MTDFKNRAPILTVLVPAALALTCSPKSSEEVVGTDESALTRNIELTVLSVTKGDTPPGSPEQVGIVFPTMTPPPGLSPFRSVAGSVDLGNCTDSAANPNATCGGLQLPTTPWKTTFTVPTLPANTVSFAGQLWIAPQGMGAPVFTRCFHVGLNTTTNTLMPLPVSSANCSSQGTPNDAKNPVTCSGATCTAHVSINGGTRQDPVPWTVKMGFKIPTTANVNLPYLVQSILYAPPFGQSGVSYGPMNTLGATTTYSLTGTAMLTVNMLGGVKDSNLQLTATAMSSTATNTQITTSTSDGITRVDNYCGDPSLICDPSLDPDHSLDEFIILLGMPGHQDRNLIPDNAAALTFNYSSSVSRRFSVAQLRGLAKTPQDLSVFCVTPTTCDFVTQTLAQTWITPSDAQQILNLNPFVAGVDITQHPARFEPACQVVGSSCTTPVTIQVNDRPAVPPNSPPVATGFTTVHGNTTTNSQGFSVGAALTVPLKDLGLSLGVTFGRTTDRSVFNQLSAAVNFVNASFCEFGNVDVWIDKAFGSLLFVPHLQNACSGCPSGFQRCTPDGGSQFCGVSSWTFEPGETAAWNNSAETFSQLSTDQHHGGTESLQVSASSDPSLPASVNNETCSVSAVGTMDVRGKTYSAWVLVANSSSSYASTNCRLRAFDRNFQESLLPASATKAPIVPGSWFQLSGVFPSTALESQIYELTIDCKLPTDWSVTDPSKVWYVDDIQVN